MKKFICVLLTMLMLAGMTTGVALAESVSVNATKAEVYFLDDGYTDVLSIPSNLPQSFQIKVTGAQWVRYEVVGENIIDVDSNGLVKPKQKKVYVIGSGERYYYNAGTSVVRVTADFQTFDITVTVKDYADYYVDKLLDDFVAKNITSSMTEYQKLDKIARFVSSNTYSVYHSSGRNLFIYGDGDCWAFTGGVLMLAEKVGFAAWARNANKDPGAGSGHMDAMVRLSDGTHYEVETSYGNGSYEIIKRTSLFSYRSYGNGIEVYQYDGEETPNPLVIPQEIEGKTVLSIGDDFASQNRFDIEEIVLPDTVKAIGMSAFNTCLSMKKINLPASLETIGPYAFAYCTSLLEINSESKKFPAENGVIYNADKTVLLSAPAVSEVTIPASVTEIGSYAFYYNSNLKSVVIPETVTVIGEGAFGDCSNMQSVTFAGDSYEKIDDFAFANCYELRRIQLPASVKNLGNYIFYYCWNLHSIYCEAESKPAGWGEDWLYQCEATVYWGETMPALSLGDINGSGEIDATDYLLLKRSVLHTFTLTAEQTAVADVNRDGNINAIDYMLVKRHVLGTFKIA